MDVMKSSCKLLPTEMPEVSELMVFREKQMLNLITVSNSLISVRIITFH